MRFLAYLFWAAVLLSGAWSEGRGPTVTPHWSVITTGKIMGLPACGKDGTVYSLNEDKFLYGMDKSGQVVLKVGRGERFLPYLLVTEAGRAGVSFLNATFSYLELKAKPEPRWLWTFELDALVSCPPAVDRLGGVYLGSEKGSLYALGDQGQLFWSHSLGSRILALAVDVGGKLLVASGTKLTGYDLSGQGLFQKEIISGVKDMLITSEGEIVLWSDDQIQRIAPDRGLDWTIASPVLPLLGCLLSPEENLIAVAPRELSLVNHQGLAGPVAPLPASATGCGALGSDGTLFLPTQTGLCAVSLKGELIFIEGRKGRFSGLVLTHQGLLAGGGDGWILQGYLTSEAWTSLWSQVGRNGGHDRLSNRQGSWEELVSSWEGNADYQVLKNLASKPDSESQRQLLQEMEDKQKKGTLLEDWPFANLLLAQIALSGIEWVQLDRMRVLNNWPTLRSRAYRLLSQTADPSLRRLLISALQKEFDSEALAGAIDSLGKLGYDYDGAICRALLDLQRRKPKDAQIAAALVRCMGRIYDFNHRIPDVALVNALTAVYQGNFPRDIRLAAQKTYQHLLGFSP